MNADAAIAKPSQADLTQQKLPRALEKIRAVVGPEHVHTSDEVLERYSRTIIPWERTCAAVVYPGDTGQIQQIVKIADQFGLPIWTYSGGKNWGYGATAAIHDGAIVMMLARMDRILEVNESLAYAVIEPGVTQAQLDRQLKEKGYKLWTDCTDGPPNGSVVGNALDRGVGETPYGDHFEQICGMEVVLPDGSLVRTGSGDMQESKSWNVFKWGTGPYLEGLFSQSNYGIVTKMGIWLMREPEAFNSYVFEIDREENLPRVIDALRELALNGAVQSKLHLINDFVAFAVVGKYPYHLLDGQTYLSREAKAQLRKQYNIAPWTFGGGIYGSAGQVRVNRALIKKSLSPYGKLTFVDDHKLRRIQRLVNWSRAAERSPIVGKHARQLTKFAVGKPIEFLEAFPHIHQLLQGIPTNYFVGHAYFKAKMEKPSEDIDPARDECGLMWAGPVVPLTGQHISEMLGIVEPLYQKHGFDLSVAMILANPRAMIFLLSIFYNKQCPQESDRARALYDEMTAATVAAGYQQYRTSVAYMDRILQPVPAFRDLADKIKTALDPRHVLAPGRYGIGMNRCRPEGTST